MAINKDKKYPLQISLDKEMVKSMDLIIEGLNKTKKANEKSYTRSMLIHDALCILFQMGANINKSKGGNNNA